MADILTLVFRTFMKPCQVIDIAPSKCTTLVIGDHSINRSLLLLAAVTAASQLGIKVSFFTHDQIQSLPKSLQDSMSNLGTDNLKKIKFAYPSSLEDLLLDVASLHESFSGSAAPTSLIIVDGLERYLRVPGSTSGLQQAELSSASHISALLFDTAVFLTQILEERATSLAPCRVIASFQPEGEGHVGRGPSAPDPVLSVLDRYFQMRCTLDRHRPSAPAAAVGPQDTWSVYLSGAGVTDTSPAEDVENPGLPRQLQMVIGTSGSMEFTFVSSQLT
ncbi:hypothetical protein DPEC_G00281150 [Dallia pectoralis]|uniref:Uncharacterized protein n=1 Tax=Dallia pectoralis TaxID=75939 RepID=A0ACC2FMS1_DALPE|nr:hypothetical protein DPEC_G00281150 [Dallia pectoralis]